MELGVSALKSGCIDMQPYRTFQVQLPAST